MSTEKKYIDPGDNASFFARVEFLKLAKDWTWEKVAKKLQMTRMMLHLIKNVKSGVSKRNLYRLEQLEVEEGVKRPSVAELIDTLASRFDDAKVELRPSDFDRGFVEIPIEYARGEPAKGYPSTIQLVRPSVKSAAKLIVELLIDHDQDKVALVCIKPQKFATTQFLNLLTPFAYRSVTEAAMGMAFGVNWRKKFEKTR